MKEEERLYGKLVIDFANGETTDEACLKHLENVKNAFNFSSNFIEKAKVSFPFLSPMISPLSKTEQKLLNLFYHKKEEEKMLRNVLNIDMVSPILDIDLNEIRIIEFVHYDWQKREFVFELSSFGGICGYRNMFITEFMELFEDFYPADEDMELGKILSDIEELDKIADMMNKCKDYLSASQLKEVLVNLDQKLIILALHKQIEDIQENIKKVLDSICQGKLFCDCPEFSSWLSKYNNLPKEIVEISEEDLLVLAPPISEEDYFKMNTYLGNKDTVQENEDSMWLASFHQLYEQGFIKKYAYQVNTGAVQEKEVSIWLPDVQLNEDFLKLIAYRGSTGAAQGNKAFIWRARFGAVLTYCLISFLMDRKNREYIGKCPYCSMFFLAKDTKRKKCYSDKCKRAYEKEKKRRQRAEEPEIYC